MIVVKDGKVISGGDTGAEVEGEGDTAHVKTLIQQQSDMMKSQEVVIQTQRGTNGRAATKNPTTRS